MPWWIQLLDAGRMVDMWVGVWYEVQVDLPRRVGTSVFSWSASAIGASDDNQFAGWRVVRSAINCVLANSLLSACDGAEVTRQELEAMREDLEKAIDDVGEECACATDTTALEQRVAEMESRVVVPLIIPESVADCEELSTVLERIAASPFHPTSDLTIRISPGRHVCAKPILIEDSRFVRVIISGDAAAQTLLDFPGGTDGVVVDRGGVLGGLTDVTLVGDGRTDATAGIRVARGSELLSARKIEVSSFYDGIRAETGGVVFSSVSGAWGAPAPAEIIYATCGDRICPEIGIPTLLASENEHAGFHATFGGRIFAHQSGATRNGYAGFLAESGGEIHANSASADGEDVQQLGFLSVQGGSILADCATATRNREGFVANQNGTISACFPQATNNSDDSGRGRGFYAQLGGTIFAGGAVSLNNSASGINAHSGVIYAGSSRSNFNGTYGFAATGFGMIDATDASSNGNGIGGYYVNNPLSGILNP